MTREEPATIPVPATRPESPRRRLGPVLGIVIATIALFAFSWAVEPQSVSHSSLLGMLPFAGILAITAMGQTLVIQQGGIDLSVPGMLSLTVVLTPASSPRRWRSRSARSWSRGSSTGCW